MAAVTTPHHGGSQRRVGSVRWPGALLAAGVGAAGGAAVALLVRRHLRRDAPNALEPEQVQAVVDRAAPEPPA